MKYILLILSLILPVVISHADIYQCKDKYGTPIYQDNECGSSNNVIQPYLYEKSSKTDDTIKNKAQKNAFIDDGRPGKLIFSNNKRLSAPYSIKVNEIRVITETNDTLVVDVIYTYKHKIPAKEMRIYVTPNHGYWSVNHLQVEDGFNVGRAKIGLSRRNMKKKWVSHSSTNTITIRFEHYPPKEYKGIIWSETVKYKKNWTLK